VKLSDLIEELLQAQEELGKKCDPIVYLRKIKPSMKVTQVGFCEKNIILHATKDVEKELASL
jgi:hypothetical protein